MLTKQTEELNESEINELADLPETIDIDPKYKLDSDLPTSKAFEEKGLPRSILMLTLVGGAIAIVFGVWLLIRPKTPEPIISEKKTAQEKPVEEPDYQAKLAFRDQELALKNKESTQTTNASTPDPTTEPKSNTQKTSSRRPREIQERRSSNFSNRQSTPTAKPQIIYRTITKTKEVKAQPQTRTQSSKSLNSTVKPIDPYKQWSTLAQLGQQSTTNQAALKTDPNLIQSKTTNPNPKPENETKAVEVSYNKDTNKITLSQGAVGILQRNSNQSEQTQPVTISANTELKGILNSPIVITEKQLSSFTISLSEDVRNNNEIILKKGTILTAQIQSFNKDNGYVQASLTEIDGIAISANTTSIYSLNNSPLIAKQYLPNKDTASRDDFIASLLSGVGRMGEELTKPESFVQNESNFGTSISQQNQTNIPGAALEGFFKPYSEKLSNRSEQRSKIIRSQTPIYYLEKQTPVVIYIQQTLPLE
ncbi:hypothetical protein [Chroococcus sp. FPU101]|uniref:hypothetical protein n=1 Tax=Chroococcus sp. FPU101 TaxID=1974212 RepID=UPI001A8E6D7D|nr:hypothetical protein [Chroococcus sp. FPU101]GFE69095.1 hypothetical protein CFPU101_17050 [Chroococcus sp. FPU101]